MEFLRAYLQNDGNIKRGAVSDKLTGKLVPDKAREIWFNCQSGMIGQVDQNGTAFYSCNNIQGDSTFLVRCFKDHFEKKTFNELINLPNAENKTIDPVLGFKKVTKKRK